jgi:REP element-mobilizing transposase RayT
MMLRILRVTANQVGTNSLWREPGDSKSKRFSIRFDYLYLVTYLLTFNCYGARLPGDQRGWVERTRGDHRGGYRPPSPALESYARELMSSRPYVLDRARARIVLGTIREVCAFRDWQLVAVHVRSNHVHCIAGGLNAPNRAIADFKAYASRALNRAEGPQRRWAREGSTRSLWTDEAIEAAVRYVADGQGEAMAVFVSHREASA